MIPSPMLAGRSEGCSAAILGPGEGDGSSRQAASLEGLTEDSTSEPTGPPGKARVRLRRSFSWPNFCGFAVSDPTVSVAPNFRVKYLVDTRYEIAPNNMRQVGNSNAGIRKRFRLKSLRLTI